MNFDDLKASFLEQFEDLKNKITESATYNSVKEQYLGFPPHIQKIIIIAVAVIFSLGLVSIPYSSISQSQDYEAEFNEKREAIRDLFKYGKVQSGETPLPPESDTTSLISSIKGSLNSMQILPEQMGSFRPIENPEVNLVKPPIVQSDVTASFKWLNLTQVIDISYKLQKLGKGNVKLTGVNMTAASEADKKDYFNVTYTLSSFSFPQKESKSKSKKKKR